MSREYGRQYIGVERIEYVYRVKMSREYVLINILYKKYIF